jgi:DNA topoisomerase-1
MRPSRAFRLPRALRGSRGRVSGADRDALLPAEAAQTAGLIYVDSLSPGLARVRAGRGFRYVDAANGAVRDPAVLDRIRRLAIPPAWRSVWISSSSRGHIQATGRDARGRKQYRYHARWREVRDGAKFGRLLEFARTLPAVRARTRRDLRLPGLPQRKVLAAVVQLLEATLIRVGNEEYARQNRSFGLTTLRDRHVSVAGARIDFRFRGKSGREHRVSVVDRRLGRVVRRCQELPGQVLFQYLDDRGRRRSVGSADVNRYLREVTGSDFTAKDFRTWAGTVLLACALRGADRPRGRVSASRTVVRAVEAVASRLGNTPAVCRRCYVHPAVIDAYLDGSLASRLRPGPRAGPRRGLSAEESRVLGLLGTRGG